MSFIDKLGDSIISVSKDVGQKAKDASGIAKLKLDIRIKQDFIKEQYVKVGKSYYEAHKDEDVPEKHYFESISEALDEIKKMELQILELRNAKICPSCGREVTDTAEFCSNCGAKLGDVADESRAEDAKSEEEPEEKSEWL